MLRFEFELCLGQLCRQMTRRGPGLIMQFDAAKCVIVRFCLCVHVLRQDVRLANILAAKAVSDTVRTGESIGCFQSCNPKP